MIEQFVSIFMENKGELREQLSRKHPDDYKELVTTVVSMIRDHMDDYGAAPDPSRIHEIDDGDYQGTLVYVIASSGYQPDEYWYVKVGYGSCSGCDTLENILSGNWGHENEAEAQAWKKNAIDQLMTLALHIVQGLKKMGDTDD